MTKLPSLLLALSSICYAAPHWKTPAQLLGEMLGPLMMPQYVAGAFTATGGGAPTFTITIMRTWSAAFGSPYTIATTTAGCSSPGSMMAFIAVPNSSTTQVYVPGTTLTDSGSNAWANTAQAVFIGDSINLLLYTAPVSSSLTTSSHLTYTPSTDGSWGGYVACINKSTGSISLDVSPTPVTVTNNATLTSGSSGTLGATNALVVGYFGGLGAFSSYGNIIGAAATGLANQAPNSRILTVESLQVSANTAGTATMTQGTQDGIAGIFSVK